MTGNISLQKRCELIHITSDWLLIYAKNKDSLILIASRTESHSEVLDI
ncbi:MAG: type II toxin-antitoxin system YafQ family toxin [Lachnospiraceae bacterium]|nr:type II toxin-antitoxin system YafQ family toxin [Lachnospiraceae bacterium]